MRKTPALLQKNKPVPVTRTVARLAALARPPAKKKVGK